LPASIGLGDYSAYHANSELLGGSIVTRWHWHHWQGLPYLTCSLLAPLPHGFFTRDFAPRTPADLSALLHDDAQIFRVKQVHGDRVLVPAEIQTGAVVSEATAAASEQSTYPHADGLMSDRPGQALWVCSADCTPALIADLERGQVAAVHSGWRGTAAGIVPKAIDRMRRQGSRLEHLRVALGPAISGPVYQVTDEVAEQVVASLNTSLPEAQQWDEPPVLPDPEPGKARLDVRQTIAQQLRQLGLGPEQIAIAPHCTYTEGDRFFSYRRDGTKAVQWSGIVSTESPSIS
jgi:YfiH family protein